MMKKVALIICLTFSLSACAHVKEYELCEPSPCGDGVPVVVE